MKTRESGMPDESRWSGFFAPEVALEKLGLNPDSGDVVDFGCGYGTFAIPAAKIVRVPSMRWISRRGWWRRRKPKPRRRI